MKHRILDNGETIAENDEFLRQFPEPANPKTGEWRKVENDWWVGSKVGEILGKLTEKPFIFRRPIK